MMVGLLLQTIIAGQLLFVYHHMDSIEDCRTVKALMEKQTNVIEAACVAVLIDKGSK